MVRRFPNILVTGTPGTGKTTLCDQLTELFPPIKGENGLTHLNIGQLIKDHQLFTEWDDDLDVPIFDDDLLLDHLQPLMEDDRGGQLVDFHSAEFFPPQWFDLIVVLRAETHVLFDRLQCRGYPESKIQENVESEIFQTVLDHIREQFDSKVEIWEVQNNTISEQNVLLERISSTLKAIN